MTAMRPGLPDPLIALLGARWAMGAPVIGAAWFTQPNAAQHPDGGQNQVGFALADGSVATAPARWTGAACLQPRAGGGVELIPASEAPPPVSRTHVHRAPCRALAPDGTGGILSGGGDGRLALVTANGSVEDLAELAGAQISCVAAAAASRACATGRTVHRFVPAAEQIELASQVAALAFDPTAQHLAIATVDNVAIWSGAQIRNLPAAGTPVALAWSPDGQYLVAGMAQARAHAWRLRDGAAIALGEVAAPPASLSFSVAGGLVAASGGFRVVCWQLHATEARRSECGVASTAGVTRVACHPWRTLIAAGYENGAVLLCQPDSADILFVRAAGGGAVTSLTWSPDGATLALGTEGGEIGVVAFPDLLFRPMANTMQEAS